MSQAATLDPDVIYVSEPEIGKRYEIVDGRKVEKPPIGNFQAVVGAIIGQLLAGYVRGNKLGRVIPEMLFKIEPTGKQKRCPDVAFVSYARWPRDGKVDSRAGFDVVPELAIEVISPSNSADEVIRKIREYFQAGVLCVWIVYPSVRQVYIYKSRKKATILDEEDDLDGGDLLPGFKLSLTELFEDGA